MGAREGSQRGTEGNWKKRPEGNFLETGLFPPPSPLVCCLKVILNSAHRNCLWWVSVGTLGLQCWDGGSAE